MPPPVPLIARIHSEDPDSVMPPQESFLTLNPDEKGDLVSVDQRRSLLGQALGL